MTPKLTLYDGLITINNVKFGSASLGVKCIDEVRDWEGGAEELAQTVAAWALLLGLDDTSELTVRLIRDYVQRGILKRPRREGKIALYGWDHLVQLLAARRLLSEGWPLQKIAEFFLASSINEIRALLPGPAPRETAAMEDPALSELRHIRRKASSETHPSVSVTSNQAFDRMRHDSAAWLSLRRASDAPGFETKAIKRHQMTRIDIAPGVELTIETSRLQQMGLREAEEITRAVGFCLTDPDFRKKGDRKDG